MRNDKAWREYVLSIITHDAQYGNGSSLADIYNGRPAPDRARIRRAIQQLKKSKDIWTVERRYELRPEEDSSSPSARWYRDAESRLYAEQEKIIQREYGKKARDMANYGWAVTEYDTGIAISTKVYVAGRPILVSIKEFGQRTQHDWEG